MIAFNLSVCIIYCIWIEFIIAPFNLEPIGSVTNGLPYPFLNDMSLYERVVFYLISMVLGILPMLLSRYLGLAAIKYNFRIPRP
jgi:hypothetical protein